MLFLVSGKGSIDLLLLLDCERPILCPGQYSTKWCRRWTMCLSLKDFHRLESWLQQHLPPNILRFVDISRIWRPCPLLWFGRVTSYMLFGVVLFSRMESLLHSNASRGLAGHWCLMLPPWPFGCVPDSTWTWKRLPTFACTSTAQDASLTLGPATVCTCVSAVVPPSMAIESARWPVISREKARSFWAALVYTHLIHSASGKERIWRRSWWSLRNLLSKRKWTPQMPFSVGGQVKAWRRGRRIQRRSPWKTCLQKKSCLNQSTIGTRQTLFFASQSHVNAMCFAFK